MPLDNEKFQLDELTLQRLVDNELSHEQIRQLLTKIEFGGGAVNWKKIALAFTENQMFERAFCLEESAITNSDSSPVAESSAVLQRPKSSKIQEVTYPNSWWASALAVSLLLVMGSLYLISNFSSQFSDDQIVRSPAAENRPAVAVVPKAIESFDRTTLASYEPDHQLETKDISSASMGQHNSSIPLYDVGRLNPEQLASLQGDDRAAREAMFSRVLPQSLSPQLVQQLQQSGGMVDQNLEFISGRLDDGRSYLIPYRTIRFLPGQ